MIPTEAQVVESCLTYLTYRKHFVWRNNTGFTKNTYTRKDGSTAQSVFRAGTVGSSDILGIASDGTMIAVECKKLGNKPTPAQMLFLDEIKKRGGYGIVAYSFSDLQIAGL